MRMFSAQRTSQGRWLLSLVITGLFLAACATVYGKNGFDLSNAVIPVAQINSGGPPRDGIPSIDEPKFASAEQASFLQESDQVLGIEINGQAKAYPLRILNWHEVVNDQIGDQAFVVTFCPLCGTGMAFDAQFGKYRLEFGVSGLLYQSDVLLYDRSTKSLWSQIKREAVAGPMVGKQLQQLPMLHTTWKDWRSRHPDTRVLSTDTGFSRDYNRSPYMGYARSPALYFDVNHQAPSDYHPKARVLGLALGDRSIAYPIEELRRTGRARFADEFAGQRITIHYNVESEAVKITDSQGRTLPTTQAFWFAWYAFHPDTEVYKAP